MFETGVHFVPEIESAIGTRGGKSAERRVERDTIDRINVLRGGAHSVCRDRLQSTPT